MAVETHEKFGDVDVVFVGEDSGGQYVNNFVDICVCDLQKTKNSESSVVFAFMSVDQSAPTVQ